MSKDFKFHNRSTEDLADEYGSVKQQITALDEHEKELGEELKARIDDVQAIGRKWTVKKSVAKGRTTLDVDAIRKLLGEEIKKYENWTITKNSEIISRPVEEKKAIN